MINDFSKGSVRKSIIYQALPPICAQLVQLAYNIVDRIYIGHLSDSDSLALTGIGLVFPITTLIAAFTNLFGMGGAPLFAIARGEGEDKKAERIMGNTFALLSLCSVVITVICFLFAKPVLYLFGADDGTYFYAGSYLRIYLVGTPALMLATGLNGFINAQGFPRIGMFTVAIGAVINLVLDPIFIFGLDMGVEGAALATVISQVISAVWVIRFLTGRSAILRIRFDCMKIDPRLTFKIMSLGFAGFIMQATNSLVQAVCNIMLKVFGGDIYISVMTVVNSARDILSLPIHGLTSGSQPVLGYNYGAKEYDRVKQGIRFSAVVGAIYTAAAWLFIISFPKLLITLFSDDANLIEPGIRALKIYFFGFVFMAFQFSGQSVFTALGRSKQAVFFSLLRKAFIVVPLTVALPNMGLGVDGVFWAEPISNVLGGLACFITMWLTVYRRLENTQTETSEIKV